RVRLRRLVWISREGRLEVRLRLAEGLAGGRIANVLQEVQVAEGVAGLRIRRVLEQPGHVREALDVRHAGEIEVAAVRLGFAREGFLEVLVALAALDALACHGLSSLGSVPGGGVGARRTQGEWRGRWRRARAGRAGGRGP